MKTNEGEIMDSRIISWVNSIKNFELPEKPDAAVLREILQVVYNLEQALNLDNNEYPMLLVDDHNELGSTIAFTTKVDELLNALKRFKTGQEYYIGQRDDACIKLNKLKEVLKKYFP